MMAGSRSRTRRSGTLVLLLGLIAVGACNFTGQVSDPFSGAIIPPNICNSPDAALSLQTCMLTLGEWKQAYLAQPQEQTWYSAAIGTVDTLNLVHIQAGYYLDGGTLPDGGIPDGGFGGCTSANNTGVNLTLNVLAQDALSSLATAQDVHGTACPTPMDVVFSYTKSDTSLLLVLADSTGNGVDVKNKYSVMVDVLENPDTNEPNDTPQTATPIALTPGAGGSLSGQNGGYLATPGDLDFFSVASPASATNPYVLWFEVSQDPSVPSPPPHKYRLQYYVYAPDGSTELFEGDAPAGSQYSANLVSIGTALLLNQPGNYYILVQGYRDSNTVGEVPGDLTFKYQVKTIIVPLQDAPEGTAAPYNNTFASAYPVNGGAAITLGSSASVIGRTSYVADNDWYAVTLAANPALALLHYKVTPNLSAGRFPALPTPSNRQLFVYTVTPDVPSCVSPDAGLCLDSITLPSGSTSANIALGACYDNTGPKCVESYREEALPTAPPPALPNLKNFEANLQVPPHAAPVTYYFFLDPRGDTFQNDGYWADDRDYSILFEYLAEPDLLEKIPDGVRPATLQPAPGGPLASVPVYLSFGIGKQNPNVPPNDVVVGLDDFDGRGDDVDSYQIALPFTTQAGWQISWSVPTTDGTNPDYDLGFTLSFCDNTPDAGTGTPPCYAMVSSPQSNSSDQLGLAYSPTPYDSWWNANASVIPDQVVYTQSVSGGVVTTTVTPYGCFCFEPRFVNDAGTSYFLMNIFPLNRTSWTLVPYSVTTGYSAYPFPVTASVSCPTTCDFTLN